MTSGCYGSPHCQRAAVRRPELFYMHELVKWSKTRHLPRLARTEECSRINNYASFVGSNTTLELNCKNSEDKDGGGKLRVLR